MRAVRCRPLLAAAAVSIFALATSAVASARPAQPSSGAFTVKGSHGYRVAVSIGGGSTGLTVSKGKPSGSNLNLAEYTLTKRSREDDSGALVDADFGHLGRIAVRFKPSGKVRRVESRHCRGATKLISYGVFEGTINFNGERGYTRVHTTRARGKTTTLIRRKCPPIQNPNRGRDKSGAGHGPRSISLSVTSVNDGVFLQAGGPAGEPSASSAVAVSFEHHDGVTIFREAGAFGEKVFSAAADLNSATMEPPAPFSGSAAYQRFDEYTTRWEGDLSVSFVGRPDVALTGRHFSWSLSSRHIGNSASFFSVG